MKQTETDTNVLAYLSICLWSYFTQDSNGVIENEELKGFIKYLMDFLEKVSKLTG